MRRNAITNEMRPASRLESRGRERGGRSERGFTESPMNAITLKGDASSFISIVELKSQQEKGNESMSMATSCYRGCFYSFRRVKKSSGKAIRVIGVLVQNCLPQVQWFV